LGGVSRDEVRQLGLLAALQETTPAGKARSTAARAFSRACREIVDRRPCSSQRAAMFTWSSLGTTPTSSEVRLRLPLPLAACELLWRLLLIAEPGRCVPRRPGSPSPEGRDDGGSRPSYKTPEKAQGFPTAFAQRD
jgi:hypothetical protein